MSEELLKAVTGADDSDPVSVKGAKLPYTFHCSPPLAGSEKAKIQYKGGDGNFYDLYIEGTLQELSATNSMITIFGNGQFQVAKEATVSATGVFGDYENDVGTD